MLECVVENSPEKTVAVESPDNKSRPDSDEAYYPAFFANPLGEQSLEDVALSHLISMVCLSCLVCSQSNQLMCVDPAAAERAGVRPVGRRGAATCAREKARHAQLQQVSHLQTVF